MKIPTLSLPFELLLSLSLLPKIIIENVTANCSFPVPLFLLISTAQDKAKIIFPSISFLNRRRKQSENSFRAGGLLPDWVSISGAINENL